MKAMILAAGRGERMRPLTDHTPKPMLEVGGKRLIDYHIANLKHAGLTDLVINHAHLGDQIEAAYADGAASGMHIVYSRETTALETGGGIYNALPLLGESAFAVVNGDVWTDYDFSRLLQHVPDGRDVLAHLVLVANPPQHSQGDFALADHGLVQSSGSPRYTFSGIGVYHPLLFSKCEPGPFPLAPLLREAMNRHAVTGEYHDGRWFDVGTPERLQELDEMLLRER